MPRCGACPREATQICRHAPTSFAVLCCSERCGTQLLDATLLSIGYDPLGKRTRDEEEDPRKAARPDEGAASGSSSAAAAAGGDSPPTTSAEAPWVYRSPVQDYSMDHLRVVAALYDPQLDWLRRSGLFRAWVWAEMSGKESDWELDGRLLAVGPTTPEEFHETLNDQLLVYAPAQSGHARNFIHPQFDKYLPEAMRPFYATDLVCVMEETHTMIANGADVMRWWGEPVESSPSRFILQPVSILLRNNKSAHYAALLLDKSNGTMLFLEPQGAVFFTRPGSAGLIQTLEGFSLTFIGARAFVSIATLVPEFGGPQSWTTAHEHLAEFQYDPDDDAEGEGARPRPPGRMGGWRQITHERELCDMRSGFCVSATMLWVDALVRNARDGVPLVQDVLRITKALQADVERWPIPLGKQDVRMLCYGSVIVDRFVKQVEVGRFAVAREIIRPDPELEITEPPSRALRIMRANVAWANYYVAMLPFQKLWARMKASAAT